MVSPSAGDSIAITGGVPLPGSTVNVMGCAGRLTNAPRELVTRTASVWSPGATPIPTRFIDVVHASGFPEGTTWARFTLSISTSRATTNADGSDAVPLTVRTPCTWSPAFGVVMSADGT